MSSQHKQRSPVLMRLGRSVVQIAVIAIASGLLSTATAQALSAPSLSAECEIDVAGGCYVAGPFDLVMSASGAERFKICRSSDTAGWGGCEVIVTKDVVAVGGLGTFTIDGEHLPGDGFQRAYYVSACDATSCTKWKDAPPAYVVRDSSPPQPVSATTGADWITDDDNAQYIVATATDAGSGVTEIRARIERQVGGQTELRGIFSWNESGPAFAANQFGCAGGGWVSKWSGGARATTLRLRGCETSTDGATRTVTFKVQPNPTFGSAEGAHDVGLRVFDRLDHRSDWETQAIGFSSRRSWIHLADGIGYQGIVDAAGLQQANAAGVGVDVATLLYQRKECAPFYWRSVDTAGIVAAYQVQNVRAMVILENFLFHDVNDPEGDDCQVLVPAPPLQISECSGNQKWRLLADWRERLTEFEALHGASLSPETVELMLVSSEVNDRCFDLAEVEEVAAEVKARFPELPVAMIYGATFGGDRQRQSQPPPPRFAPDFDVVGLFSYNLYDVNDPLEPRNATGSFYDPEEPNDPHTVYGDLLYKLQPHQRVLLVFDANLGGPKKALGWTEDDLAEVAVHTGEFTSYRPEVSVLGGFTWQSLLGLPQAVIDVHADVACQSVVNDSPLCAEPVS